MLKQYILEILLRTKSKCSNNSNLDQIISSFNCVALEKEILDNTIILQNSSDAEHDHI